MYEVFRPKSNYIWAGVSFMLIILFAANSFLLITDFMQKTIEFLLCIVLAGIAYLIWVRPKLVLGDVAIEVVNPLSREVIPYSEVRDLETKWALTIVHSRGKTRVWVAPASGKRRWIANQTFGWYGRGVPLSESRGHDAESMSSSLDSLSGQAAYIIRERMKRLH